MLNLFSMNTFLRMLNFIFYICMTFMLFTNADLLWDIEAGEP